MAKGREKILKAAREKQSVNYKGNSIRLSADFSTETLPEKSDKIYLKCWKEKICNLEYFIKKEYHLK